MAGQISANRTRTPFAPKLDELLRLGVTHIASFVPWQALESDISHTLPRFLQAVAERKMTLSLILTPEVGVHYPNSGFPKDVISRQENIAYHCDENPVAVGLPPNSFALPSLFAPEFTKRYYSFLSRMDSMLADLERSPSNPVRGLTIVLTGSLWKYYRSARMSSRYAFGGMAGDHSGAATLAYRRHLESYFSQREFMDPSPASANRWRSRAMEDVNRRCFYQQSEDVFRARTSQMMRRKASGLAAEEIELYTPEADPSATYSNFLQVVAGGHADFARLSKLVDEMAARSSLGGAMATAPFIHWTSLGGFRSLADAEKQFLILKSLLLMGGQGGGIFVDESEWFGLSQAFRSKAEMFARSIAHGDLRLKNRALYLAPHLWSRTEVLWEEIFDRVGAGARMISSIDLLSSERDASVVIVDPAVILTRDHVEKLLAWAELGRVVVVPRSSLYTEMARTKLEQATANTKRIEIDLGVTYRLHSLGNGKFIVYDLPENLPATSEFQSSWQTFLTAVLSVAEVQGYCRLSDSRLTVIPLEKRGGGLGLFIMNGSSRQVTADIIFPSEVGVSDLAVSLSTDSDRMSQFQFQKQGGDGQIPANRFALEVPPCGILPLAIDGASITEQQERSAALQSAEVTRSSANNAAMTELPGFEDVGNMSVFSGPNDPTEPEVEAPWN